MYYTCGGYRQPAVVGAVNRLFYMRVHFVNMNSLSESVARNNPQTYVDLFLQVPKPPHLGQKYLMKLVKAQSNFIL